MFEVKGWKLSAPLKADTSVAKKRTADNDSDQRIQQTKSKKRKRSHGKSNEIDVTVDNLADVWQQHIEGKPVSTQKRTGVDDVAGKKEEKRTQSIPTSESRAPNEGLPTYKKPHGDRLQKTEKQAKHDLPSSKNAADTPSGAAEPLLSARTLPTNGASKLTALQSKMSHKLASARFRHLNQQLYTTPSIDSLTLFKTNPDMFTDYHTGFAQQVEVWPENPVDSYVADILARGKVRGPPAGGKVKHRNPGPKEVEPGAVEPLPRIRDRGFQCVIADLGCGTAKLSSSLQAHVKKLNLKMHSFDLHAPSPLVTAADIANLPLADGSIDVAIACLALMGTNWTEFVEEAWRVLRWKGEFWVAEIKSRFSRSSTAPHTASGPAHSISKRQQKKQGLVGRAGAQKDSEVQDKDEQQQLEVEVDGVVPAAVGKGETDVKHFVKVLERRGFVLEGSPDLSNKMFVKMRFIKAAAPVKGKHVRNEGAARGKKFVDKPDEEAFDEGDVLKPCVYKLR